MAQTSGMVRGSRKGAGARAVSRALILGLVGVLLGSLVLGASPAFAYTPQGGIEPNPQIEGNVTFATHLATWSPLEYNATGGGQATLPARLDSRVVNPILVNPTDVVAPGVLQGEKIGGTYWNTTGAWSAGQGGGGSVGAIATTTVNGEPAIKYTLNTSAAVAAGAAASFQLPSADWPSTDSVFDYLTFGGQFSGPTCSACTASLRIANQTQSSAPMYFSSANGAPMPLGVSSGGTLVSVNPGGDFYVSVPLSALSDTANDGLNVTGPGAATSIYVYASMNLVKEASVTYTFIITDLAFTTGPLTLGATVWHYTLTGASKATNNSIAREEVNGNLNLSASGYAPTFATQGIQGGGYQAAVTQTAADTLNATVTTSPVSIANATAGGPGYVEQATYQFAFLLPTAPQLTYGAFKLADDIHVAGTQYVSVAFAGTSYTAAYQGYAIGAWQVVQATITPTTAAYWTAIVDYTGPQWDSISAPPGIFSAGGLEYYWFVFLGLILATVGGTSAWITRNERQIRQRRGVAPPIGTRLVDWLERRRRLHGNTEAKMSGRHTAAVLVGLVFAGAGGIAVWASYDGADLLGATAAFIGGLIVLLVVALIAFVAYEVAHRVGKKRRQRD